MSKTTTYRLQEPRYAERATFVQWRRTSAKTPQTWGVWLDGEHVGWIERSGRAFRSFDTRGKDGGAYENLERAAVSLATWRLENLIYAEEKERDREAAALAGLPSGTADTPEGRASGG